MDRSLNYPGAIPLDTDLLSTNKNALVGLGNALQAALGTAAQVDGLACAATLVPSLAVQVSPGAIYSSQNVDGTAYGSLGADTTHQVVKQGLLADAVTLATPAPGTAGQSVVYLVQAAYADQDATPVVLPYYNAANPAVAYSGPANSGVAQNTVRKGVCVVSAKAGVAAATGTQAAPAPDAGYVGLYAVTVANAQSTVTAGNIAPLPTAPFLPVKLPGLQVLGSRPLSNTTGGISLVRAYAGDPNGSVAGNAAAGAAPPDLCWDTANSALYVCAATGTAATAAWAAAGAGRKRLAANRTYYVRTNGSDANDGLANTAGGAFLTVQRAVDEAYKLDFGGYTVTVQVADGTYPGTVKASRPFVGGGVDTLRILGNAAAPANCTLTASNDSPLDFRNGASGSVGGFTLATTGSGGSGVFALGPGTTVAVTAPVAFGTIAGGGNCLSANTLAQIVVTANLTYTAAFGSAAAASSGFVYFASMAIAVTGSPTYSGYFATSNNCGVVVFRSVAVSGAATGTRYYAQTNGVIDTALAGASYLPGNTAGTLSTGGQYV